MNERTKANRTQRGSRQPRCQQMRSLRFVSRGRKIPASSNLGISIAQVDPREGERPKAKGERLQVEDQSLLYLKPQASSLKPSLRKDKNRN
jgi:hypothetical protein